MFAVPAFKVRSPARTSSTTEPAPVAVRSCCVSVAVPLALDGTVPSLLTRLTDTVNASTTSAWRSVTNRPAAPALADKVPATGVPAPGVPRSVSRWLLPAPTPRPARRIRLPAVMSTALPSSTASSAVSPSMINPAVPSVGVVATAEMLAPAVPAVMVSTVTLPATECSRTLPSVLAMLTPCAIVM